MGVQFHVLEEFLAPHAGLFWATIKSEYPKCREEQPIIPQIEQPDAPGRLQDVQFSIAFKPTLPRLLFEHHTSEWVLQIQNDRFLHNWRQANRAYPRYEAVREKFAARWQGFTTFLKSEGINQPSVRQLEITYLNRIGPFDGRAAVEEVFPDFHWRNESRYLAKPSTTTISCTFDSEDRQARLRLTLRPAFDEDQQNVNLLYELTVRGIPDDGEHLRWFDRGREWIVNAFEDTTSEKWHEIWRKEHA